VWFTLKIYIVVLKQDGKGKLKGEIELSRVTVVEKVDMEALKGIFFQVHKNHFVFQLWYFCSNYTRLNPIEV